jgi:hypothetical protein
MFKKSVKPFLSSNIFNFEMKATSSKRVGFLKGLSNRSLSCSHWTLSAPRVTEAQSAECPLRVEEHMVVVCTVSL